MGLLEETDCFWDGHKGFSKRVAFNRDAVTDRVGYLRWVRGYFRQKEYINRTTEKKAVGQMEWAI